MPGVKRFQCGRGNQDSKIDIDQSGGEKWFPPCLDSSAGALSMCLEMNKVKWLFMLLYVDFHE